MAQNIALEMTRGDTPSWTITVTRHGAKVDLTGATLVFTARKTVDSPTLTFQHSTGTAQLTISNQTTNKGEAVLSLLEADTSTFPLKDVDLVFDLEVTEGNGYVSTPVIGTLAVYADVHH